MKELYTKELTIIVLRKQNLSAETVTHTPETVTPAFNRSDWDKQRRHEQKRLLVFEQEWSFLNRLSEPQKQKLKIMILKNLDKEKEFNGT